MENTDLPVTAHADAADVPLNVLFMPGKTEYSRMDRLGVHRLSTGSLLFRKALQATVTAALGVAGGDGDQPAPSYGDVQKLVRP